MFLRYVACFILLVHTNGQKSEKLTNIFSEHDLSNQTLDSIRCSDIDGILQGCYDCYTCDELTVDIHRSRGDTIKSVKLIDDNCETTEVCCISQGSLSYRNRLNCGVSNPGGYPRSLRTSARSVLQGEYPWMAWIYSTDNPSAPICGATVFGDDARTLITSATCVYDEYKESLYVSFESGPWPTRVAVEQVVVHENFDSDTSENNIAILSVEQLGPSLRWVKPACLTVEPPHLATPCVALSADMNYINTVLVQTSSCAASLSPSLMCALAPPNDYLPQHGSGLFCLDESGNQPTYFVYGITLYNNDKTTGVYTDVSHFSHWIQTHIPNTRSRYG